ncbi:hypothetical protein ACFQ48_15675 [Hymenobacter caeli]|uniref:Copper chaperone PCu(A)C n=1 Tax=Hymenobacter caeli TaxID=2735894 RepID=A0ABX2FU75_9BACT|nr:hypothetical protein [Hymenobacter caeli]NRT20527.1 hypothetical protein [Hymenobacter caeli]
MRTLFLAALLAGSALLAVCGGITSTTFIDAGKQFVLGGRQRGAFRVAAHNVGPVPVSVAERRADGTVQERGRLDQGQRVELAFGAGSAALVRNLGERQAVLGFRITGDTSFSMGMGYEVLQK